ncbi:MAG: hypothetical protein IPN80_01225 [Flavobacterium sp.]|nr:hypothetical protein [Flavobacterium sp.]
MFSITEGNQLHQAVFIDVSILTRGAVVSAQMSLIAANVGVIFGAVTFT